MKTDQCDNTLIRECEIDRDIDPVPEIEDVDDRSHMTDYKCEKDDDFSTDVELQEDCDPGLDEHCEDSDNKIIEHVMLTAIQW